MWSSLARGQKLALVTLVVELALALLLISPTLGLFALIAMPFVGLAWLPSAGLMLSDLRQDADQASSGYLLAGVSGVAGAFCLYLILKWTVLGMSVQ